MRIYKIGITVVYIMYNFVKNSTMKILLLAMLFIFVGQVRAQEDPRDAYLNQQTDSILGPAVQLEELVINKNQIKADELARKQFLILQRRVYRVYPFAKAASERLTLLNQGMSKLTSDRDKRKYFKIVENYLTNEFEAKLKNLSRKDGQILVKLIHRQTGSTTFQLIKDLKSGWKAFWSNNTARLFDINLKTEYRPIEVNEDYLIETILTRAFASYKLPQQNATIPIDYDQMVDIWKEKLGKPKG